MQSTPSKGNGREEKILAENNKLLKIIEALKEEIHHLSNREQHLETNKAKNTPHQNNSNLNLKSFSFEQVKQREQVTNGEKSRIRI